MQYALTHHSAEMAVDEYIQSYQEVDKFIGYCKVCKQYGNCWACPPFHFDLDGVLQSYMYAYVLGTKITLIPQDVGKDYSPEEGRRLVRDIIKEVRLLLDEKLLSLENELKDARVFFAGTCHFCETGTCTRKAGQPCRYPDKIRPSLESFGFDIGKTTQELLGIELKWSENGALPAYLVLVSGLFSKKSLEEPFVNF